jgi:hypothetical protein
VCQSYGRVPAISSKNRRESRVKSRNGVDDGKATGYSHFDDFNGQRGGAGASGRRPAGRRRNENITPRCAGGFAAFLWSAAFLTPPLTNPKSEFRNPKQIQNAKSQTPNGYCEGSCLGFWVWCFGLFRISSFGFRILGRARRDLAGPRGLHGERRRVPVRDCLLRGTCRRFAKNHHCRRPGPATVLP